MKVKIIFFITLLITSFCYAKKKTSPTDNTFSCSIENNSSYNISVDGADVSSGEKLLHNFPLHNSALYDGWDINYKIPLTETVFYSLNEKKSLIDNQAIFSIDNPIGNDIPECYVVIHNFSTDSIQVMGKRSNTIFQVFEKGYVNKSDIDNKKNYTVSSNSSGVFELKANDSIEISNDTNGKRVPLKAELKKGFFYDYIYKDGNLFLRDKRPIQCAKESSWIFKYSKNETARDVIYYKGKIYITGSEFLKDKNNNSYVSTFIQCLDRNGNELWKQFYGKKGCDTFIYDIEILNNSILLAGQVIQDDVEGLILIYDLDGIQKNVFLYSDVIGFEKVIVQKNKNVMFAAYDNDGIKCEIKLTSDYSSLLSKINDTVKFNDIDKYLHSIDASLITSDGNEFFAGETAFMEQPLACVVKKNITDGVIEILYTAKEATSYISDMKFSDNERKLIICGSLNGKDSYGNYGNAFIRCVDIDTKLVEWECISESKAFEAVSRVAECDDYGFIKLLVNADEQGNITGPCVLVRTDSIGRGIF